MLISQIDLTFFLQNVEMEICLPCFARKGLKLVFFPPKLPVMDLRVPPPRTKSGKYFQIGSALTPGKMADFVRRRKTAFMYDISLRTRGALRSKYLLRPVSCILAVTYVTCVVTYVWAHFTYVVTYVR